ncbi:MAG TPA: hypothetical protein VM491_09900 [Burkholderiaceae bacterium]|nr:hypothetical protein [Burkholderiaceae bacterium]
MLSTFALTIASRRETGRALAATNSTSHWIWPQRGLVAHRASLRYTGTGYAIHHAMSVLWAMLYEAGVATRAPAPRALTGGLAIAALACLVDYTCTPSRLTPGFERRLSKPALATAYAAFAAGLALTTMARAAVDVPSAPRRTRGVRSRQ